VNARGLIGAAIAAALVMGRLLVARFACLTGQSIQSSGWS
jgi:hypothetical protein